MKRETLVPSIPDIRQDNVQDVLRAIKSTIDVREGSIGDPLDQVVTLRELAALNLANADGETTTAPGSSIPVTAILPPLVGGYNPGTDYTVPPAPTGLRATGGFTNVYLEWDGAPYRNHNYTEIWRAASDDVGGAFLVGTTAANTYADPVQPGSTFWYWVRFVSSADVRGPFNQTSGTPATTALDVAAILPALEESILTSQLFADLGSRVAAAETGIASLSEVTATTAKQTTTLTSSVDKNSVGLQIQSQVSDGLSAQYTVKIDNNGHVSGFGLASTTVNGTPTSAFIVRADRFAITGAADTSDPLGTLSPTNVPFVVLTTPTVIGGMTYPAGVWMKSAFIADATISSAKIQSLVADKITTGSLTASMGVTTGRITGGVNTAYSFGSVNFGTGFYLGNDAGTYKFRVGSYDQNMTWDGSSLSVSGTINAIAGVFRNITVYDSSNNVILSSGGINTSILGLGSLAYQSSVSTGQVTGLGSFATLNQINTGNVSTYIASGAIGNAYIGDFIQSSNFNGTITTGGVISNNGTTGWAIGKGGKAVFQDLYARGDIQATSLNAATGTFSGSLSAASGTFSGTLTASAINAVNTINIAGEAVTVPRGGMVTGYTTSLTGDPADLTIVSFTTSSTGSGRIILLMGKASISPGGADAESYNTGELLGVYTFSAGSGGGVTGTVSVVRTVDGVDTVIMSNTQVIFTDPDFPSRVLRGFWHVVYDSVTPGSTVTYKLRASSSYSATAFFNNISYSVLEAKR